MGWGEGQAGLDALSAYGLQSIQPSKECDDTLFRILPTLCHR